MLISVTDTPDRAKKAARTGTRWRCLGSCNEPLQGWALVWGRAGAENREMKGRWHQGRMMEPNEQTRPAPVPAGDGPNHHCTCVQLCPAQLGQDYARDTTEIGMGGVIAPMAVFLKTAGTLRLHWNYSVSKQQKLNGSRHTCSWQTALSKDTINSVPGDPKPLCSC